jgi:CelD/BcsL family acetyltransferase involved in cellulose biosynthesis
VNVTLHTLADLPEDALALWRRILTAQDPAGALTGSPEWLALMTGDARAVSALVARDSQSRACVVLPGIRRPWNMEFRLLGRRLWSRSLDTLKIGGGDLLADGADAGAVAEALREGFRKLPDVAAIWFEHVADDARLLLLESAARRSGSAMPLRLATALPHYRLRLPPTHAEALALRSGKSLSRLRSKENALAREAGAPIRVVEIRTPEDWAPYEERIERLMNASWQAQLLGHEFLLDRVRGTALRGWLRAFLLLAGEEPLAFTLYYQGMDTISSAALGYDRRYARFSPGAILFRHTLERLYAADTPRILDFGEGDADYKRQWSNERAAVSAVLLVRRRAGLMAGVAVYRILRAVTQGARALLRRLGLERQLVHRLKRGADDAEDA